MAVTEFLKAVDEKKKAEQAAMAAAPVSAEVAPAAPAMQTPVATPQQLDQMLADPATVSVGKVAPAAPSVFGTPAPVDPIARPDVPAAAPTVQAPAGQGTVLATPEAPTAAPEVKAPGIMDTITENFAGSKLGKFFGGMTTYDVSRGGDVVSGSGNPVFPSLAEKTETPAYGASDIPVPPAVEMATPESIANLSVNGTDVVTPEAITEAGQVAPEAVAPETPTAGSGGMITRDSTGESFIGGSQVAATPEEVSAYNATSSERMAAANTDAAAAERMRYNAPTIAEATGAGQTPTPRAPVRQSTKERDRSEKQRAQTLREEGQRSIEDQMREFNREPHSTKERAAEKARLQGELNAGIKEDRDYNRATAEANFTNETAEYNRNTLTAAQQRVADVNDRSYNASQAEKQMELDVAATEKFDTIVKEGNRLDSQLSFLTDSAMKMAGMQDWSTEGFAGWAAEKLPFQTKAAQVNRLATSFQGNAFLRSIIDSKSLGATFGALSDTEGTKITAAEAILMDTKMGNEERMDAAKQIIDTIKTARATAGERLNRAGGGGQGRAAPRQVGNVPQVEGVTITQIK